MKIPFTKMVGAGNDFIVVDAVNQRFSSLKKHWPLVAQVLCDRNNGAGADGILLLEPSKTANVRMRIFNADGSEADMCGNGARCAARLAASWNRGSKVLSLETANGILRAHVRKDQVRVQMTVPKDLVSTVRVAVDGNTLEGASLNTGVPHLVLPVDDIEKADVFSLGRSLRHHETFQPAGTNVNFIQQDPHRSDAIFIRTYERGVERETLACGTGSTAAAILFALGLTGNGAAQPSSSEGRYRTFVNTRSGDVLEITFTASPSIDGKWNISEVIMAGPARIVYAGTCEWPLEGRNNATKKAVRGES